ncbi:MAG: hypothetical protein UR81_C0007G0006 [Candidatus Levybacteria bacterium GW2011_GWB1_35_5]|nr:MAG: hypothetical protein UR81_C0007G0006 [Candidatus Levybacteria bacterium GW2011_GWB1_35_5]
MGSFGGFYKGDKKKQKKDSKGKSNVINPSVFVMPEIISKKKKDF